MRLTFHRLLQKDLRSALSYYDDVAGPQLARRLYDEFESLLAAIEENPRRFHVVAGCPLRRANFRSFPYHLLFRETANHAKYANQERLRGNGLYFFAYFAYFAVEIILAS